MPSEVEICNLALAKIGGERITGFDDGSRNADLCQDLYAPARDDLLRAHTWNFATKRVKLAKATADPVFGYDSAFALPADCLRAVSAHRTKASAYGRQGRASMAYKVEGRQLLSNGDDVWLRYIYRVTDTAQMPPDFVELLAVRLARDLALPVTQSNTMEDRMEARLRTAMRRARSSDGLEDVPDQLPESEWVSARAGRFRQSGDPGYPSE